MVLRAEIEEREVRQKFLLCSPLRALEEPLRTTGIRGEMIQTWWILSIRIPSVGIWVEDAEFFAAHP
jgi:hypothetical protein